jgi:prevent-host-death family protein
MVAAADHARFDIIFYESLWDHSISIGGGVIMPNIKPVSDLRNYNSVLRDVAIGEPVFLTKNGRGRYALVDIQDYEKIQADLKRMAGLAKGEPPARENGWLLIEEMEASLGVTRAEA